MTEWNFDDDIPASICHSSEIMPLITSPGVTAKTPNELVREQSGNRQTKWKQLLLWSLGYEETDYARNNACRCSTQERKVTYKQHQHVDQIYCGWISQNDKWQRSMEKVRPSNARVKDGWWTEQMNCYWHQYHVTTWPRPPTLARWGLRPSMTDNRYTEVSTSDNVLVFNRIPESLCGSSLISWVRASILVTLT